MVTPIPTFAATNASNVVNLLGYLNTPSNGVFGWAALLMIFLISVSSIPTVEFSKRLVASFFTTGLLSILLFSLGILPFYAPLACAVGLLFSFLIMDKG